MRYSWEFGELTDGFEWYEGYGENTKRKSEKENGDGNGNRNGKGSIKLLSFLAVFLVSSYVAGGVISADGESLNEGDEKNEEYGDAVAVMSYGDSLDVGELEAAARISELAAAYIEEYMCENYSETERAEE